MSFITASYKNISKNKLARSTVRGVFKKRTIAAKVNSPCNVAPQRPSIHPSQQHSCGKLFYPVLIGSDGQVESSNLSLLPEWRKTLMQTKYLNVIVVHPLIKYSGFTEHGR